jgi:DNA-binding PucR family transcriptional regulator
MKHWDRILLLLWMNRFYDSAPRACFEAVKRMTLGIVLLMSIPRGNFMPQRYAFQVIQLVPSFS